MDNTVSVASYSKYFERYEEQIKKSVLLVLKYLGKRGVAVDVILLGSVRMRELGKTYLGKDKATNVVSVEAPEFPRENARRVFIGEIYLCPPYIKKHGEDMEYMLIHGLLHLLGFNHEIKSDRILMETTEKDVLRFVRRKN